MSAKLGREERYVKRSFGMAVRSRDWEQIERSHDEQGHKVVDHTNHMETYKPSEQYTGMLSEDYTYPSHATQSISGGKSTKMIHDVSMSEDDPAQIQRTMSKPYHADIKSTNRSWIKHPIRGWSTIATKALYDAANIGGLVEDVSVHEHKGVPMTVHNFAKDFDTVYDLHDEVSRLGSPIRRYPNPLQVYQIAAMDFLTGNVDRHGFNLMIGQSQDDSGHHPLLAIDHENSFQYHKSLAEISGTDDEWMPERNIGGRTSDKPYDYLHLSTGLHKAHEAGYDNGWEDFHVWWSENAEAIQETFVGQLEHIKNDRIKDHLQRNFDIRFNIIQRWAGDDEQNHQEINLFDSEFPYEAKNSPMELAEPEVTESIVGALPADPVKAILMIGDVFEGRSVSIKHKLLASFNKIVEGLNSEQFVKLYDKAIKGADKKIEHVPLSRKLLMHILKTKNENFADALLAYENTGKPGKIPIMLKRRLREI